MEWKHEGFTLSDNSKLIDLDTVFEMLSKSYWANNRTKAIMEASIKNSLCFCLFHGSKQVGFMRVITDSATFAYLCDVIIDENFRGKGLGKWMVGCVLEHPALKDTRQYLCTKDAQGLYEKFGFLRSECMRRDPANL